MAVRNKKKEAEAEAKGISVRKPAEKRSQQTLKIEEQRQKAMSSFHGSVVDWFKRKLDLDLATIPVADLFKLGRGEFTSPLRVAFTPLAYDSDTRKNVEMPRIAAVVSLRAVLPTEKGNPLPLDADHKVFLQSVPCRPLVELAAPGEAVEEQQRHGGDVRETNFTKVQKMALEGIGITPERLYGGFNHLSRAEKLDILDGEIFPVEGSVKTDFGFVNIIGDARLVTSEDGKTASVTFEPFYPEKRAEGMVIDLERARVVGNLELDFFRRTPDNRIMLDASGAPMLNRAGENILDFGAAMEPVKGFTHSRERGSDGAWKEVVSVSDFNVRVINGSLFPQKMAEKEIVLSDGSKGVERYVPGVRMSDNKVFVAGESRPLAFRTEQDRKDFLERCGGVVTGATYKDFKTGKNIVYDAFVVPTESGFAQKFSPATTEKILARREAKAERSNRRKARFGRGLS